MKRPLALWTTAVWVLLGTARVLGAEIPANLDARLAQTEAAATLGRAGVPAGDALALAASLDQAELAQLARTDTTQQGGIDPLSFAIVVATATIVLLMWIFTVCDA